MLKEKKFSLQSSMDKASLMHGVLTEHKAKEISFSPHSKETAAPKELSLREELEAQFRKEF